MNRLSTQKLGKISGYLKTNRISLFKNALFNNESLKPTWISKNDFKRTRNCLLHFNSTLRSLEADCICTFVALIFLSKSLSLPSRCLPCSLIDFSSKDTVETQLLYRRFFSFASDFASSSSFSIFLTSSPSYSINTTHKDFEVVTWIIRNTNAKILQMQEQLLNIPHTFNNDLT